MVKEIMIYINMYYIHTEYYSDIKNDESPTICDYMWLGLKGIILNEIS